MRLTSGIHSSSSRSPYSYPEPKSKSNVIILKFSLGFVLSLTFFLMLLWCALKSFTPNIYPTLCCNHYTILSSLINERKRKEEGKKTMLWKEWKRLICFCFVSKWGNEKKSHLLFCPDHMKSWAYVGVENKIKNSYFSICVLTHWTATSCLVFRNIFYWS